MYTLYTDMKIKQDPQININYNDFHIVCGVTKIND